MKYFILSLSIFIFCPNLFAQQRLERGKMVFVPNNMPNAIVYNDTIYKGAAQFKNLFMRTGDVELIHLLKKHQANKIAGNAIGVFGASFIFIGTSVAVSPEFKNRGTAWVMAGGGLVTAIFGSYLVYTGQKKLQQATDLFNKKYASHVSSGIGATDNGIGLIVKF